MTDMGGGEVTDNAFIDPFETDWDDDEMNTKATEYQRLLDDADLDHNESLTRLGDMDESQLSYLNTFNYQPEEGGT